MKRIIKCGTAFLLALVLCLCLLPTTAFAASKQVYIWNFPLSDDTLRTSGKWGHGALNLRFGYHVAANNYTQFRCLDAESFLDCIREELPYRDTTGFRYEVLTDDPAVCKAADDILLDFFSEDDPYTLSEYTQKMGGI